MRDHPDCPLVHEMAAKTIVSLARPQGGREGEVYEVFMGQDAHLEMRKVSERSERLYNDA